MILKPEFDTQEIDRLEVREFISTEITDEVEHSEEDPISATDKELDSKNPQNEDVDERD